MCVHLCLLVALSLWEVGIVPRCCCKVVVAARQRAGCSARSRSDGGFLLAYLTRVTILLLGLGFSMLRGADRGSCMYPTTPFAPCLPAVRGVVGRYFCDGIVVYL